VEYCECGGIGGGAGVSSGVTDCIGTVFKEKESTHGSGVNVLCHGLVMNENS